MICKTDQEKLKIWLILATKLQAEGNIQILRPSLVENINNYENGWLKNVDNENNRKFLKHKNQAKF